MSDDRLQKRLRRPATVLVTFAIGLTLSLGGAAACIVEEPTRAEVTDTSKLQEGGCAAGLPGAGDLDSQGCPRTLDPYAELSFEDALHRGWYQRFWFGDCDGLSGSAWSECGIVKIFNPEYWFDTVDTVVERAPPDEQPSLRVALWRLGRLIGHEWARANDIRQIDTDDIEAWGKQLREAPAERLCAKVNTLFATASARLIPRD